MWRIYLNKNLVIYYFIGIIIKHLNVGKLSSRHLFMFFQGSRGEIGPVGPPGPLGKLVSNASSLQQCICFIQNTIHLKKISKERKTIYKGQLNHLFLISFVM